MPVLGDIQSWPRGKGRVQYIVGKAGPGVQTQREVASEGRSGWLLGVEHLEGVMGWDGGWDGTRVLVLVLWCLCLVLSALVLCCLCCSAVDLPITRELIVSPQRLALPLGRRGRMEGGSMSRSVPSSSRPPFVVSVEPGEAM